MVSVHFFFMLCYDPIFKDVAAKLFNIVMGVILDAPSWTLQALEMLQGAHTVNSVLFFLMFVLSLPLMFVLVSTPDSWLANKHPT